MVYDVDKLPAIIDIGFTGEEKFRTIQINMTKWMAKIPNGTPKIVHIRPGESKDDAYIATTTFENNILSWEITASDLGGVEGIGLMEVWLENVSGNTIVKRGKSTKVATYIHGAINDPADTIPPARTLLFALNAIANTLQTGEPATATIQHDGHYGEYKLILGLPRGPAGETPIINISEITGGHRVTFIVGTSEVYFDVLNGEKGDTGDPAPAESVGAAVTAWMDENITEDPTVVIDKSLYVEGAAADALATGTKIRELKTDMMNVKSSLGLIGTYVLYGKGCPLSVRDDIGVVVDLEYETAETLYVSNKNLCNFGSQTFTQSKTISLPFELPAGTYTFSADVSSNDTDSTKCCISFQTPTETVISQVINRGNGQHVTVNVSAPFTKMSLIGSDSWGHAAGDTATFANIQLEVGNNPTEYVEHTHSTLDASEDDSFTIAFSPAILITDDFSDVTASTISGNANPKIPDLYDNIERIDEEIDNVQDEISEIGTTVYPVNKYDASSFESTDFVDNAFIYSNGTIHVDQSMYYNYFVTPKIPVKPSQQYTIIPYPWYSGTTTDSNRGRVFDANDDPLDAVTFTINNTAATFTTPAGASYVRFNCFKNGKTFANAIAAFNTNFMLVEGSTVPATYQEYFDPYFQLNGIVPPSSLRYPQFMLPLMYGKQIVNFGDSIFGNIRPPKDLSTLIAKHTGATVYNCAFGGCQMSSRSGHWDAFSMYRLAYAVAHDDFSVQDDAITYDDRPSYAAEPLGTLKGIDFSKVDMITIAYGTNDFGEGATNLDNADNRLDTSTVCGALRYSLDQLLTAYPAISICVLGLIYRTINGQSSDTYENAKHNTIAQYNAKLKEVADEFHVRFIDNSNIGFNAYTNLTYFSDGTHPNDAGLLVYARHIANEIN